MSMPPQVIPQESICLLLSTSWRSDQSVFLCASSPGKLCVLGLAEPLGLSHSVSFGRRRGLVGRPRPDVDAHLWVCEVASQWSGVWDVLHIPSPLRESSACGWPAGIPMPPQEVVEVGGDSKVTVCHTLTWNLRASVLAEG